jgi:prevent-host-death family protein
MKRISVQDLKASLSSVISEAESGKSIVITRHNHPVAQLIPAQAQHVHQGAKVGKESIKPALKRGSRGRYLSILLDDRNNR